MIAHVTDRLSAYLDGELSAPERVAVEAHLAECAECAATAGELRALIGDAAALPEPQPPDLWPAIAARLQPRQGGRAAPGVVPLPRRRRLTVALTVPQLIAAALLLMVLPASAVWLAAGGAADTPVSPAIGQTAAGPGAAMLASYEPVIDRLEREFEVRRGMLEPGTILVVERNLAIIDQAITEARLALEADPSSGFLRSHLASTIERKADLLRQAASIGRADS